MDREERLRKQREYYHAHKERINEIKKRSDERVAERMGITLKELSSIRSRRNYKKHKAGYYERIARYWQKKAEALGTTPEEARRQYAHEYYQRRKEHKRKVARDYYSRNKDKHKAYLKMYWERKAKEYGVKTTTEARALYYGRKKLEDK